MNYDFISKIKEMQQSGFSVQETAAYNSIIDKLYKKNIRGKKKLTDIDDYDGESLFGSSTLFPGCIYTFQYAAKKPGKYTNGEISFEWYDPLPIVLITRVTSNCVSGINLNMCDYSTRTYILNLLYNLDLDFYNGGDIEMYKKGKRPISPNVCKVFMNKNTEDAFYQMVKQVCNLKCTTFIFRSYSIDKIKNPRLIEIWQYKHIPFLKYTGELKGDILKKIWAISGIANRPL